MKITILKSNFQSVNVTVKRFDCAVGSLLFHKPELSLGSQRATDFLHTNFKAFNKTISSWD